MKNMKSCALILMIVLSLAGCESGQGSPPAALATFGANSVQHGAPPEPLLSNPPQTRTSPWVKARHGVVPPNAVEGGYEHGRPLYICQAPYQGGLHPGKLRPDFGGCNIGWGGREVTVPQYAVLTK